MTNTELKWIKEIRDNTKQLERIAKRLDVISRQLDRLDRKTENSSEIPNNCKYAENPSGDVWECGCFLDTYCEHQIYDRNPDGTINIVKCGYEPKTEPFDKDINVRSKDEPQINASQHVQRVEYVGNDRRCRCWKCKHFERMHETPISSDGSYYTYVACTAKECHYEPKNEPQTERSE